MQNSNFVEKECRAWVLQIRLFFTLKKNASPLF